MLGDTHPDYAKALFELAYIRLNMSQFEAAEGLFQKALALQEEEGSGVRSDYATTVNGMGVVYLRTGRLKEALDMFQTSADIHKEIDGQMSKNYADALNNVGVIHFYLGDFRRTLLAWNEVRDVRARLVGKDHVQYAGALNNIALCYLNLSKFELAEPMFLEARSIWENRSQTATPTYAGCLINLGRVYKGLGITREAETYLIESCRIWKEIRGVDDPDYAMSLRELSELYQELGRFTEADSLLDQALRTVRATLGPDHPEAAFTLSNQARSKNLQGHFEQAVDPYLEALEILERAIGKETLPYTRTLQSLAGTYMNLGDLDQAEALYAECVPIYRDHLGLENQEYSALLFDRSMLSEVQGHYRETEALLREKAVLDQSFLLKSMAILSETELEDYVGTFEGMGQMMFNYLFHRHVEGLETDTLAGMAVDHLLFLKGFVMTAANRLNVLANSTINARALEDRLNVVRGDWSSSYVNPTRSGADLQTLEEEARALEKELVRTIAGYDTLVREDTWQRIRENLKPNEVAVEFTHFPILFPQPADSIQYAALVITPDQTSPLFVPLFEGSMLDILNRGDQERRSAYVDALYTGSERGLVRDGISRPSLYQLIWQPVIDALESDIETIYFSPSGILHRLNLAAIAVDDEAILSDRYRLIRQTSTRQIGKTETEPVTTARPEAVIFAGIEYEADSIAWPMDLGQPAEGNLIVARSATDESTAREERWPPLKWTYREGERIASLMQDAGRGVISYAGQDASEATLKARGGGFEPSPGVLHIATHGFFLPDPQDSSSNQEGGAGFRKCEHSMIRSGLVLAGGNHAWLHGTAARPGQEDGILTAFEISQMDLSNTELVVLSACETGLGDIEGIEGVYGLQRAFKIAGAKYLIMSLWQVPDRETMEFMTTFYTNWLPTDAKAMAGKEEKMSIPDAFRKTQLEMRDRFFNPYSWAGFVLVE